MHIERLSSSWRSRDVLLLCMGNDRFDALLIVLRRVDVLFLEGPLLEVPLYSK